MWIINVFLTEIWEKQTSAVKLNGSIFFSVVKAPLAFSNHADCFWGCKYGSLGRGNISSMNNSSILRQYCSTDLLMICARSVKGASTIPNSGAHSGQRSEVFCFLILVDPFQLEQEVDRGIKRVEQIDNGGTVTFISGGFKLAQGSDNTASVCIGREYGLYPRQWPSGPIVQSGYPCY